MEMSASMRDRLIAANQREYGERYEQLLFLAPSQAQRALGRRAELLDDLHGRVTVGNGGTKLDCTGLSPGCRICAEGGWSCLFVTGRCNCRCFYCPTSQTDNDLPTTNGVDFRTPADYVGYLERFGFRGASISGGEPLLSPKRSLAFVRAVKKHFGDAMHVWLYTNGTLADKDLLFQLADAGLDEIRFDIGATDYQLDKLRLAAGVIPTVTVEIPAIPEDLPRLKGMLSELRDAGVMHLNLHQMRLTPYNFEHLAERGYTFLHGERVTVLESELAALEVLQHSLDNQIGLPVNYCSFVFKNRYQAQAGRLRNGPFMAKPFESLTENGYIRTLTLLGEPATVTRQIESFKALSVDDERWSKGNGPGELRVHPQLLKMVDGRAFRLQISYATCRQLPTVSYSNPFITLPVSPTKSVIIERARAAVNVELGEDARAYFIKRFLEDGKTTQDEENLLTELIPFEQGRQGLQDYF